MRLARNFLVWGTCLVLGSCGVHNKTVHAIDARGAQLLSTTHDTRAEGASINWRQAVSLLLKQNPQILQAKLQQENATKRRKRYWKNYIPGLRGSASFGKDIGRFNDLSLDDFNVYAFLNLRVPNPITVQGEMAALSLFDYRSTRSYELIKRRQVVALYREFIRYDELQREYQESLQLEGEDTVDLKTEDLLSKIRKTTLSKAQRQRLQKSMELVSMRISQMLQIPDYKIRPQLIGIPTVDYSRRYSQLDSSKGYGRLALQILATDIEGARLRHQRIRLEKWPRISFGASAPQVYSSESSTDFDVDSIRLFGNLTKGFEIMDDRKERTELSKREYERVQTDANYRMIRERQTLRQAQRQYGELLGKKRSLNIALQINRDLLRSGIVAERLMTAVEQRQQISEQIKSMDRSIKNQELEFWIWDESAWK